MQSTAAATAPDTVRSPLQGWKQNLSFGPGLLFALSMLGPGDLVSNVAIGATHGYALLWALAVVLAFRFVWLNTSARYVLVTGETLLVGYGRLGRWIPWLVFVSLLASRHLSNLYKIMLMGAAADLLVPLPVRSSAVIWSLIFAAAGFVLMSGDVRRLERWFRPVIASMGAALLVAVALSHPNFPSILRGAFVPSIPGQTSTYSSVLLITALIGAEAGALTNVSYSYFMYQRGWRDVSFLGRQRFDLLCGVGSILLMGALLQVAAAGTLMPAHLVPKNAEHLVVVFSSALGVIGKIIFAFGLWAVCFSGFVAGTTGYALIGSDIWKNFRRRKPAATEACAPGAEAELGRVRRWLIAFWCISPLYILLIHVRPVWLVLVVSSLTVLLMPALGIALMVITNDSRRMGAYKNRPAVNIVLGALVVITLYFSVRNAIELLQH